MNVLVYQVLEVVIIQITFKYKNWKNEISIRNVEIIEFWIGSTEYHKDKQILMRTFDLDKQEERNFATKDIIEIY